MTALLVARKAGKGSESSGLRIPSLLDKKCDRLGACQVTLFLQYSRHRASDVCVVLNVIYVCFDVVSWPKEGRIWGDASELDRA